MEQQHADHLWAVPAGDAAGRLVAGRPGCPLRPRSLALLGYLVGHAGRVVPKAELHAHVWREHACHRFRAAGVGAGDSGGVGRRGGGAAVSGNRRPAGLSVAGGRRPGRRPPRRRRVPWWGARAMSRP